MGFLWDERMGFGDSWKVLLNFQGKWAQGMAKKLFENVKTPKRNLEQKKYKTPKKLLGLNIKQILPAEQTRDVHS